MPTYLTCLSKIQFFSSGPCQSCLIVRSAVLSVYLAAALSFGAGVLRDWQLVAHVAAYQQVFGAMYAVALAASFSVNALTLGQGFQRHPRRVWFLVGLSVVLFVLLVHWWLPMDAPLFWWTLPVPALYVVGALYARRLLDAGHVLIGRLRDGTASLVMLLLLLAGMQAESFPVAVAAGTLMVVFAARWLPAGATAPDECHQPMPWQQMAAVLFYSNIATVMMNAWALWANGVEGLLYGYPVPVAVRVATYVFQLLSLPSVLLARWRPGSKWRRRLWLLTWACIAAALIAAALPLRLAVWLLPSAALATLYASVLLMGVRNMRGAGG